MGFMMVTLHQDLARPFNSEMYVRCAKYFQRTFVALRFLVFTRSIDVSKSLEEETRNQE